MCGIAGIWYKSKRDGIDSVVQQMTDAIAHRGPDGEGHWISDNATIALGHRRLSIIDLSENANQPMHFGDRYVITFNGEIYNYVELKDLLQKEGVQFATTSDTEVLLAAYAHWGKSFLSKLDGMFAFVIYDKQQNSFFCARDRFGEKPFFFYNDSDCFAFGSEMKALFSAGIKKTVNEHMLFLYLAHDVVENPEDKQETFFHGIYHLPPSSCMTINSNGDLHIEKYWSLQLEQRSEDSFEVAVERFTALFDESIKRRMRSDVAVGTSLSGGIDSSSIVSSIMELYPNSGLNTFSARFNDELVDEGNYIELLQQEKGFNAHYCYPSSNQIIDELDLIFKHQEEPFGSSSIIAQWEVMKLAKAHNTTVLLDGQGADETLAGYFKYYIPYLIETTRGKKSTLSDKIAVLEKHHGKSPFFSKREIARMKNPKLFDKSRAIFHGLKGSNVGHDLSKDFTSAYGATFSPFHQDHSLNAYLEKDLFGYGLGKLLRFSDRNAMAHSREVRLPFLSHELVEYVFSLPATYKIHDGWTKYILRESIKKRMPDAITYRVDKLGFQPPSSWMGEQKVLDLFADNTQLLRNRGIVVNPDQTHNWRYLMAGKLLSNNG